MVLHYSNFQPFYQSSPSYLHGIVHFSRNITGRVSRNINRLFAPRVSYNFGEQSFYHRAVLWNSLSQAVVEVTSTPSFKRLYFDFL